MLQYQYQILCDIAEEYSLLDEGETFVVMVILRDVFIVAALIKAYTNLFLITLFGCLCQIKEDSNIRHIYILFRQ